MAEILKGWALVTGFDGKETERRYFSSPDSGEGYYQATTLAAEQYGLSPDDYRFTYPNGFCLVIDRRIFRVCIEPIFEEHANPDLPESGTDVD